MGSVRLFVSVDPFDSAKFSSPQNPFQFPDQFPISSIASCILATRACIIGSLNRVRHIKVSRPESEANQVDNDADLSDQDGKENGSPAKAMRRYRPARKRTGKNVGFKFSLRRVDSELERENYFVDDGELDVNYSAIKPNLSFEHCNAILKRLERFSDENALKFFEWMRRNGKLEGNVIAFTLVLRVLSRREEWDRAEVMIREACGSSGCGKSFQIFNTVIYTCSKKSYVELGSKLFRMMLEFGVQPNVATFGMLMGLYQKSWSIEDAEFAFSQMRNFRILCESAYSAMITIYTRLRLYDKAEQVIELMKIDEVKPNLENWLVMLNAYCQQGKLEHAEAVLASMNNAGFPPNIIAYNTLIKGYGKVSNMADAQRLFQNLQNLGLDPDETTYRSMIEGWGRMDNYTEAKWYYKELKRLGYRPNSSNLYTLLNLQAKHGDIDGAIKTLNDTLEIGCQYSSILGILLQVYEKVGKVEVVPLVLSHSFHDHIRVNQTSCSMLAMAYVKHGLVNDAIKLMRDKKWKDAAFETNLYHLLICSCKESGRLHDAVKIYTQMADSSDKLNLHITCTMIDVYTIMGQFREAEKLYVDLKCSGVALDMIGLSIVVRMYMKAGCLEDACSVLAIIEKHEDIRPDIYLFRDMLRIYQKCGKQDKLASLYHKMLNSGMTWDQETYNCVINCCARALSIDELSRIFDEMIQRGFTPNTVTFNVMLDVYGKAKLFKKVQKLFLLAKKHGLVDVISYNTLIAAYGQNKDFKNLTSVVQEMQFDGFSVSLEAYNCMLDAYGKDHQMENFRSVLQRLKESSYNSDHYTYNIMINIYGEQGWIDEVVDVLTELREYGLAPDLCSYNTLIKAYGIAGMVEEAVGLVKEMRENGIQPDKITYVNLIAALRRNDMFLEAVRWSLWMKQMGL